MNKLLTKIVGAALGLSMTVGVGVAVASQQSGGVQKAEAAGAVGDVYTKITSMSDLTSGSQYLIVSSVTNKAFNGGLATDKIDANSNYVEVTITNNSITTTSTNKDAYFTIAQIAGKTTYSIQASGGFYIGSDATTSSASNELDRSNSEIENNINYSSSRFTITGPDHYLVFNAASGTTRFRYYKSTTNINNTASGYHDISLYKKNDAAPTPSISFSDASRSILVGGTTTQTATTANIGSNTVSYSSNDTSVATVDASTGEVTGVAVGSATITASVTVSGTPYTATYTVNVSMPSISFSSPKTTVFVGQTQTNTASGELGGASISYSSATTSVATVNASTGEVTGVSEGTSIITASATVNGTPYTANYTMTVRGENTPYSVAEAYAAIDGSYGLSGAYATGIVSEIVTAYSSQYGNISYNISDDGETTSDQLQAFRGKSYNGNNFTSEDDIQVGDIVVVYGTLKKYNSTYEFDANNRLVSLQRVGATFTLTYNGNGNDSGSVPEDSNSPYNDGSQVTVLGNTGNLAKSGYVFGGWNTKADGTGTSYVAGATFNIIANTILYAQWIVTLDSITSIGGTVSAPVNKAGTTDWDFSQITVTGTLSGVSSQSVLDYVDLSSSTQIPSTIQTGVEVSVTATKKAGITGSATYLTSTLYGSVEVAKLTYTVVFSYEQCWSAQDKADGKVGDISYANETSHAKKSVATCAGHDPIDIYWGSNNVMNPGGNSGYMQFRANQTPKGYIYNTTEFPGDIKSISYTPSAGEFENYFGSVEHPTSGSTVGNRFFTVAVTGSSAGKIDEVTITFEVSDKPNVQLVASNMNLDVSSGAVAPTITDGSSAVSGCTLISGDSYIASITNDGRVQPTGYGKVVVNVSKAEDASNIYLPTTFTVSVTDSSKEVSAMDFIEKANGSATADDGIEWTINADQSENDFSDVYGINFGTGSHNAKSLTLTTPADGDRIIKNVVVEAMSASGTSSISVSVGETNFTCSKSTTLDGSVATYNFSGNTSGLITITLTSNGSSKLGVKSIHVLYVGDEATSFASTFLGAISCNSQGTSKPSFNIKEGETSWTWALLAAEYNSLSAADKAKFAVGATGVSEVVSEAVARYDYIVGKYYKTGIDTSFTDFMNRNPSPIGATNLAIQPAQSTNSAAIIVIVSVISLSAVAGYFMLRKRKEQ